MVNRNTEAEMKAIDALIDEWDLTILSITDCVMKYTVTGFAEEMCRDLQKHLAHLDIIEGALKRLAAPSLRA